MTELQKLENIDPREYLKYTYNYSRMDGEMSLSFLSFLERIVATYFEEKNDDNEIMLYINKCADPTSSDDIHESKYWLEIKNDIESFIIYERKRKIKNILEDND